MGAGSAMHHSMTGCSKWFMLWHGVLTPCPWNAAWCTHCHYVLHALQVCTASWRHPSIQHAVSGPTLHVQLNHKGLPVARVAVRGTVAARGAVAAQRCTAHCSTWVVMQQPAGMHLHTHTIAASCAFNTQGHSGLSRLTVWTIAANKQKWCDANLCLCQVCCVPARYRIWWWITIGAALVTGWLIPYQARQHPHMP